MRQRLAVEGKLYQGDGSTFGGTGELEVLQSSVEMLEPRLGVAEPDASPFAVRRTE
jgi:hypothetical protein